MKLNGNPMNENKETISSRVGAASMFALLALLLVWPAAAQLDETCVVSAFNRTARVEADGTWVLPNVPSNLGRVRVRANCVDAAGVVRSGQSDFFEVPLNGVVEVAEIVFDAPVPIAESLEVTAPVSELTAAGATLQLTVSAVLPASPPSDVTADPGTVYTSSNPAVATVAPDGLVTAVTSGGVLISVAHEGAIGLLELRALLSGDADGDGLPDDFEVANGLDANNPFDALDDQDGDRLTTLEEFLAGLDPFDDDGDDDGLVDGEELEDTGTDPRLFDTDGEGVSDGLEVFAGSDPLDNASVNLPPILADLAAAPEVLNIIFDTVVGEASRALTVEGTLIDGTVLDVTGAPFGTAYTSADLAIASFGIEPGRVFAGQVGTTTVAATNGTFSAAVTVNVESFSPQALSFIRIPGFANGVAADASHAFVAAGASGLVIVDVADLASPAIAGSADTPGNGNDVRVVGDTVYLADGTVGLQVIDASNRSAPSILGTADTPGTATDLAVSGGFAYVADGGAGLAVIDVSDPSAPFLVGSVDTPGNARGIDVASGLAVVADAGGGVHVVDVTDPALPAILGSTHTRAGFSRAADVVVRGGFAYVADGSGSLGGVKTIDLREPANPVVLGASNDRFGLVGIALEDNFVLTADYFFVNAVPIFDVGGGRPIFSAVHNFGSSPSFRDDNGNGVAVRGGAVFLVGARWTIRDNGVFGDTGLHIGRYRAESDDAGIAPRVVIAEPGEGAAAIERTELVVRADASDDIRVTSVTFLIDGESVASDFKPPFEARITVPAGVPSFRLGALARDLGDNAGSAEEVLVDVIPDDRPAVVLIAPTADSTIVESTTMTLAATASDDLGVTSVAFFVDGALRGTRTAPPYRISTTVPSGVDEIVVEAEATDTAGQTTRSTAVTVPVERDMPPIVELLEPEDGTEMVALSRVRVIAGASDDRRVQRVRFFVNGVFRGEDFEPPYESEVTGPADGASLEISAVAQDDRGQTATSAVTIVGIPDPGTTVEGTVLLPDRQIAVGAEVSVGGVVGTTDLDGRFSLPGAATVEPELVVRATLTVGDEFLVGFSAPGAPVRGGVTEVGEILLFPGFPNGNGGFETGDFTGFQIAGQTQVLEVLGPVAPPEGSFMGFLSSGFGAIGGTTSIITTDGFNVPEGVRFLAFDFNFLSNEFPSFVGSIFNDALTVRISTSDGLETSLEIASVNGSSFVQATGTGFNGMTGFSTLRIDVSEFAGREVTCVATFEVRVFDRGDTVVDSAGLIDNLRFE